MQERQNQIINILQSRPNAISINNLSGILKYSTRTIRNEIKEINDEFRNLSIPEISINRGMISLSLTSSDLKMVSELQQGRECEYLNPNERFVQIILDFVSNQGKLKVYEEQGNLFISKSTIDQDMRRARKFLEKFGLKLIAKEGVVVEGQEKNIRTMLQQLIMQEVNIVELIQNDSIQYSSNYESIRNFLDVEVIQETRKKYKNLIATKNYSSNAMIDAQVIFTICLWSSRISKGFLLKDTSQDIQWDLPSNRIANLVSELVLSSNVMIPRSEIRYIYYLISSLLVKNTTDIEIWSKAQILTLQLIEFMSNCENVNYQKSEQLFEQLNLHMVAFEQRRKKKISIYNPLTDVLKEGYKQIFNDVRKFTETFFEEKISENEIAYITVYFSTYYEKNITESRYYRIAVLCNYGLATGQLLAANIKKNFDVEIVSVLGMLDQDQLLKLDLDFVVKTVDSPVIFPSIKLPPVMLPEDFRTLESFMKTIEPSGTSEFLEQHSKNIVRDIVKITENDLDVTVSGKFVDDVIQLLTNYHISINESEVRPMIESLLSDDKIQLQVDAETWKEAIEKSAEPLLNDSSINENYVKAMIKSVIQYGAYIVIGPGIALAHARPEEGAEKLGISVITLKEPINFGSQMNDPVKIVFCLSAIDNYSHLNVMKAIVRLLNQPSTIDKLHEAKNLDEFKEILFSK